MRVCLISLVTPTPENVRAASALPYHLLLERDKNITVRIYSFNNNNVGQKELEQISADLDVEIKLFRLPKWIQLVLRFNLLFIRLFLSYPIYHYISLDQDTMDEIKLWNPDGIWIYGQDINRITAQLSNYKVQQLLPDCESLYYYRMLRSRHLLNNKKNYWRNAMMYPKYCRMEMDYMDGSNIRYCLVGREDVNALYALNPRLNLYFLKHPHYHIKPNISPKQFRNKKIKLLLAGQNNQYMYDAAKDLCEQLSIASHLHDFYDITFLGHGWDLYAEILRTCGYAVEVTTFVEDYLDAISQYDIQMTPISVGTGTKGKVLDALANGLLVIGTEYALENIQVKSGESCLLYRSGLQAIQILEDIPNNPERYEIIASHGRDAVLTFHGRSRISRDFFSYYHN